MLSPFWLSACCFAHFSCMLCLDSLNNFPPKISSNFLGRSSIFCSAFFVAFVFVYKKTHRYNRCVLIIHLKSNRTNAISNACQVTDSKSRRTSNTKPPNQTETAKRRAGNSYIAAALSAGLTGTAFLPSVIPLQAPEHLSDSR